MSMQVMWDNTDKSIIRIETEGTYTWEEYTAVINKAIEMADTHESVIGMMAVRSADATVPEGANPHYARTTRLFKERPHLVVVNVKSEPFVKVMTEMFAKIHDVTQQLYQAKSVEEARSILKQVAQARNQA